MQRDLVREDQSKGTSNWFKGSSSRDLLSLISLFESLNFSYFNGMHFNVYLFHLPGVISGFRGAYVLGSTGDVVFYRHISRASQSPLADLPSTCWMFQTIHVLQQHLRTENPMLVRLNLIATGFVERNLAAWDIILLALTALQWLRLVGET